MKKPNSRHRKILALLTLAASGTGFHYAYSNTTILITESPASPSAGSLPADITPSVSSRSTTPTPKAQNQPADIINPFESALPDADSQQHNDSDKLSQEQQQDPTLIQQHEQNTRSATFDGSKLPSTHNVDVRLESIKHGMGVGNRPPSVNAKIQQQLQRMVDSWAFTQDIPAYHTLPIDALFDDPDGDSLTTRASVSIPGIRIMNRSLLTVQGIPTASIAQPRLTVEARDNHHGSDDDAWVKATFTLAPIEHQPSDERHPLVGNTLYRLETSHLLAEVYYNYEVVYCEAWKLDKGIVYFAASANKTQCPTDGQLQEVGQYTIHKNNDVVISSTTSQLNAQQRWTVKKEYSSSQQIGTKNIFTTVYNGSHIESYTLQQNKSSMEARLNVRTGESAFQMTMFDYLYPQADGTYAHGIAGNYIFDYRFSPPYPRYDSDLNLQSSAAHLSCDQLLPYWQSTVLAGAGETGDIISTSVSPINHAPIDCGEAYNPDWKKNYVYLNLEYQAYDYFVPGEIYSYVLKPKQQYAHLVEELKLNLHYHHPLATNGE